MINPRMWPGGIFAAAAFLALTLLPHPGDAQVLYGSLVGNVTEESQAVIPGAEVTITNKETNLTRRVLTNEAGSYSFPNVQPGNYSVKIKMAGFAEFIANDVVVGPNSTVRRDAMLKVGGIESAVTITADSQVAQLQTDRGEIRHELQTKQFEDLPVSLAGNYQSLLQTLPGFEMEGDMRPGRMGGCNPSGSVGFSVNGTTTSTTSTNVDGATNAHIWNVGRSAVVPTLESIEGVNVVTNSFDAEQGMAGGAVISVQTKTGSNRFHGSAFEYHYNQHMKARDYFRPAGQEKGKFIQNRFGGTVAGPIKRDKIFFFSSMGATLQRDNGGSILSLPSALARTGDFSNVATVIYDPATGNPDGSDRIPFPNNQIPANRIDPIAKKILGLVPLPNLPGLLNTEANNFFASQPFGSNMWSFDNKVNWQASSKFNTFVSWNYAHDRAKHITAFGEGFIDGPRVGGGNAGDTWGYNNRISVGGNYIFAPSLLMDAFWGWTRQNTNVEQPGIGENYGLKVLGLPGTNGPERFQSGWPRFSVTGYSGIGTEEAYSPYYRNDDQYSFRSNFTNTRQGHEIRWGTDINSEQMNHIQPEFQGGQSTGARGLFSFGTGPTTACLAPDGKGGCTRTSAITTQPNAMATFLLGLPTQVGKNRLNLFPYTTRTWRYSLYVRDRWQVNQKLTLNYGVRWEYFPMPTRADRGFERYNPINNMMYIGGVGDVPKDLNVQSSKKLFAPRFGMAYRVSNDMVVRGGYGISWDPYSLARALRTNHPVLTELVVTAVNALSPSSRLADGIPEIATPNLGNGIIPIPGNVSAQTVPNDLQRGYIQSWNLTIQRTLFAGWVGEAGYVGTRQIRQIGYRELNWARIGGGNTGRQLFQAFGRSADTRQVSPIGGSHYDALQARVQRRFYHGYSFTASYTFGKSISSSGLDRSDSALKIVIPEYYGLNRSVTGFDRRHNLQFTNILALPLGKGQRWLSNAGVLSTVVSNWQTNSIVSMMSGRPFSITGASTSLNAPGNTQRADQVKPEVAILGGVGRGQPYFDTTAYAAVNEARFGTAGFNSLYGPGRFNWDFSLFRVFRLTEGSKLEFRAESFNFTNTPKFGNPAANVSTAGFGEITSATEERQFQVGLRIQF
ncbi:MAG TPA: TonB-dependent receptor [Bryobacteraceae bacterium]|nr:TonB-dependent receptor [Bryobacteraceae bacterium]